MRRSIAMLLAVLTLTGTMALPSFAAETEETVQETAGGDGDRPGRGDRAGPRPGGDSELGKPGQPHPGGEPELPDPGREHQRHRGDRLRPDV